jgi:TIR domain-containing protein/predicted nucleotide-binding protein with TIR-like domain
MKDFFISYSKIDQTWAEWIAWQLEEAGYTTVLQSWDFRPGTNFVREMHKAASETTRTIAVLSSAYVNSLYVQPEWAAAFAQDPTGEAGILLPVRVEPVELSGLLAHVVYIDLVGKDDEAARIALLNGITLGRAKPMAPPGFPGAQQRAVPQKPLTYPGAAVPDPLELAPYLEHFKLEHADPRRSAFVMMRFGSSLRHNAIFEALRKALAKHEIEALRADEKTYADYLMANIRTYMHGCGFGVAVFERIESDQHNPNVALEVGYMMALGKPVCLLKDRTLSRLPTDIIGALYREFDLDSIDSSIEQAMDRWLKDKRVI